MRLSALKRDNTIRIISLPRGDKHWNWNNEPSLLTLHKRIHRKYGAAKFHKCSMKDCKKMAHDWANKIGKYTDKIEDYHPLCRSHHVKLDKNWLKRT